MRIADRRADSARREIARGAAELIRTALDLELSDGTVIADHVGETPCVFLARLYQAERGIADRLVRLLSGKLPWPQIDPDKALPWVEQRIGLQLAEARRPRSAWRWFPKYS